MSTISLTPVLPYPPREVWYRADVKDSKSLARLLKDRRNDLKGTALEVTQPEIAEAIRQSQTQVWKIENGAVDITKWFPDRQRALLEAYNFTEAEIQQIAEKYNLDVDVKNTTSGFIGDFSQYGLVSLRVLGNPNKDYATVLETMLKGYDAEECFLVNAGKGVLVCDKVRDSFRGLPTFVFKCYLEPKEGQTVAYKMKNTGELVLCLCKETPPTFAVIDYVDLNRAEIIYPNDERLEYLGVMLTAIVDGDPPS